MLEAISKGMFEEAVETLTPRFLQSMGWRLIAASYPVLDILFETGAEPPLRVRLRCDSWNDQPPSIELLSPEGVPITTTGEYAAVFHRSGSRFNPGPHTQTGHAFVCMPGSREFHTHEGHLMEVWDNYRDVSGYNLVGLLMQLSRTWQGAS